MRDKAEVYCLCMPLFVGVIAAIAVREKLSVAILGASDRAALSARAEISESQPARLVPIVMAGLGPAIHVFVARIKKRRG